MPTIVKRKSRGEEDTEIKPIATETRERGERAD